MSDHNGIFIHVLVSVYVLPSALFKKIKFVQFLKKSLRNITESERWYITNGIFRLAGSAASQGGYDVEVGFCLLAKRHSPQYVSHAYTGSNVYTNMHRILIMRQKTGLSRFHGWGSFTRVSPWYGTTLFGGFLGYLTIRMHSWYELTTWGSVSEILKKHLLNSLL